jgi:hypothetical protein
MTPGQGVLRSHNELFGHRSQARAHALSVCLQVSYSLSAPRPQTCLSLSFSLGNGECQGGSPRVMGRTEREAHLELCLIRADSQPLGFSHCPPCLGQMLDLRYIEDSGPQYTPILPLPAVLSCCLSPRPGSGTCVLRRALPSHGSYEGGSLEPPFGFSGGEH